MLEVIKSNGGCCKIYGYNDRTFLFIQGANFSGLICYELPLHYTKYKLVSSCMKRGDHIPTGMTYTVNDYVCVTYFKNKIDKKGILLIFHIKGSKHPGCIEQYTDDEILNLLNETNTEIEAMKTISVDRFYVYLKDRPYMYKLNIVTRKAIKKVDMRKLLFEFVCDKSSYVSVFYDKNDLRNQLVIFNINDQVIKIDKNDVIKLFATNKPLPTTYANLCFYKQQSSENILQIISYRIVPLTETQGVLFISDSGKLKMTVLEWCKFPIVKNNIKKVGLLVLWVKNSECRYILYVLSKDGKLWRSIGNSYKMVADNIVDIYGYTKSCPNKLDTSQTYAFISMLLCIDKDGRLLFCDKKGNVISTGIRDIKHILFVRSDLFWNTAWFSDDSDMYYINTKDDVIKVVFDEGMNVHVMRFVTIDKGYQLYRSLTTQISLY